MKKLTSREFNRDTGGAKKAAEEGPVFITDRGRPSHVLLTFSDYQRLAASHPSIVDVLSEPKGVEDIDLEAPTPREPSRPARFD
ncbi:MAG TPA: type II toxin-antitoxin system prevent-host-death family antitoxin [Thermoanaerobaculia bacterium]|nr:type II toxin-antitoxin system prevent-host-death family antitoxin [Thermoanaerobaculia bacterium]